MSNLRNIGIVDDSFNLVTVADLIADRTLYRPMDGNHGELHPKVADYVSEGIPFVMANDLFDGKIMYDTCNFITKKQADELRKGFSKVGDVLLTHKATIGRTGLVGVEADPYVMLTPQVTYYRIRNPQVLDNRYLLHYFADQFFQKTLAIWAGAGATRAYLGITGQHKLPIIVPPIDKQKKIAAILTAYDDLIENNKRRIALLEKMAEEIYREWFVRMRFPGHQKTKFIKGIPEGWTVKKLGELVKSQYGYTESANDDESNPKFLRITDIVPSCIDWDRVPHCPIGESDEAKYQINEGDILVARTGATVGYAKRINRIKWRAVFASYLVRLIPNEQIDSIYLGLSVERQAYKDFIQSFVTGAAQPQANAKTMGLFPLFHPDAKTLIAFNEMIRPVLDEKEVLLNQNANLTQTRDLLLPRLISGKLSVEALDIQFPPSMREEEKKTFTRATA